jgi:hypothetical protein
MFDASLGIDHADEAEEEKDDQDISIQGIHHIFDPPGGGPSSQPVMDGAYGHDMMQDEEGRNELTEDSSDGYVTGCLSVDPAGDEDGDGGQQGDNDHQYREMFNDA